MPFEAVIGLEVHAQLKTKAKIFCGCSTAFGAPPNTHTCPVCLGMPGVLPVLNQKVVEYTLRMALATHCEIAETSRFARKNYFYPDLPKGYQISQYELPIARNGFVQIQVHGTSKRIGITRIHMEEDAGKLIHDPARPFSFVDFNRTGVPLIEIVSEPDIRSAEEAGAYLKQLRSIVRYLDICDGNMEEGSFRCDANISVRPQGEQAFGTRTELKNLNSFKYVEKGLEFEIKRQQRLLEDGGQILQESRLWDTKQQKTTSMRGKEDAHDYRYFPDPDLLPVVVSKDCLSELERDMPELPLDRQERFIAQYGLRPYDAEILTSEREIADYFEDCLEAFPNPKIVSNWIIGPVLGLLKAQGTPIAESAVSAAHLAQLLNIVDQGRISNKMAKNIFDLVAQSRKSPEAIVREKGLSQVTDQSVIEKAVREVISDFPDEVIAYQQGKTKLLGFFVGQVLKKTKGQANPKMVNQILRLKL